MRYKEQTGDANAPQNYTSDGYNLGTWQSTQRQNYKNGNMDTNKVKRLEETGFNFAIKQTAKKISFSQKLPSVDNIHFKQLSKVLSDDPEEGFFNKGFQETLRYKEQVGDSNASYDYQTPEGYPLGEWQELQRRHYRHGGMRPVRIKMLEEIGFKWILKG